MRISILALTLGLASAALFSCNNSNEPGEGLLFSRMEISYIKSSGWSNTSKLYIHKNGSVEAYILTQAKGDTVGSGSTTLSDQDRNDLANLFEPFSTYDPYYEPENPLTDQDIHTTILVYEEVPDTVTVYMPDQANIPDGMRQIIDVMESLIENIVP